MGEKLTCKTESEAIIRRMEVLKDRADELIELIIDDGIDIKQGDMDRVAELQFTLTTIEMLDHSLVNYGTYSSLSEDQRRERKRILNRKYEETSGRKGQRKKIV